MVLVVGVAVDMFIAPAWELCPYHLLNNRLMVGINQL
jgi:hypothetical protein